MNLKKIGKVFTSKFVGTGLSSYEKRIYLTAVSQSLRNTVLGAQHPYAGSECCQYFVRRTALSKSDCTKTF